MGKKRKRLDVQMSIIASIIIITTSICVYYVQYRYSYDNMLYTLYERVYAIYNHLDTVIDKQVLLDVAEDDEQITEEYLECYSTMIRVKNTTGVRYLYIATKNDEDQFMYLFDSHAMLDDNYHPPGSNVNMGIFSDIVDSWEGEVILGDEIQNTTVGKIFITYFPIYFEDEIIAVLVIAVDAEHQYNTYHTLQLVLPVLTSLICVISITTIIFLFRRISNPHYKDYANTDQLTQLKNRNSYDVDMENLMASRRCAGIGILVADLNDLKVINDTLGHQMGDNYIKAVANALKEAASKWEVVYRVGGDEFVVIFHGTPKAGILKYMEQVSMNLEQIQLDEKIPLSVAMGYSIYSELDEDLYSVYRRADKAMYENKSAKKMKLIL